MVAGLGARVKNVRRKEIVAVGRATKAECVSVRMKVSCELVDR